MNKGNKLYEGKAKIIYETKDKNLVIQHLKMMQPLLIILKKQKLKVKAYLIIVFQNIFIKLIAMRYQTHFVKRLNMREQLIKKAEIFPTIYCKKYCYWLSD